ncbi:hypothetical protein ACFLRF_06620 [Candidatus Altiarchaeota archaeon]
MRYGESLTDPQDKLVVFENILFLSTECLSEREQNYYLSKVLGYCQELGIEWKYDVYSRLFNVGDLDIELEEVEIKRIIDVPTDPKVIIIGASSVNLTSEDLLGIQVERILRDWLSQNLRAFPNDVSGFNEGKGVSYMEGDITRRIVSASNTRLKALPNSLIVGKKALDGMRWYAMDDKGKFRFEVLEDKVYYPTTKCMKNVCLLVDTHGISSLVPQAINGNVSAVIGCGDYYDKMKAAYYLAKKGINVIYPCDRFASEILFHDAQTSVIGTAPVREVNGVAVIGASPVSIALSETVVVQTTTLPYPAQYYDAPDRYFSKLIELTGLPLKIKLVETNSLKQTGKVVEAARKLNVSVIAVRVAYREDYLPVREWLSESDNNRAILFHTAPYSDGYKLFDEFPTQTSFGDPKPIIR